MAEISGTIRDANAKRQVTLPDGTSVPCLGQGTWLIIIYSVFFHLFGHLSAET
jgi:hypothetical protein